MLSLRKIIAGTTQLATLLNFVSCLIRDDEGDLDEDIDGREFQLAFQYRHCGWGEDMQRNTSGEH